MNVAALITELKHHLAEQAQQAGPLSDDKVPQLLNLAAATIGAEHELPAVDVEELITTIHRERLKLGPIWQLMFDKSVTEIMVNGPDAVFVERRGQVLPAGVRFVDDSDVRRVVGNLVAMDPAARVDLSHPMGDLALPDGSRVNITIPPVVFGGAHLTIRKHLGSFMTVDDFVAIGSLDERMAAFLVAATQARRNVLFSGGTGTGKTTLVEVLSRSIDPAERLVCIEDTRELTLDHPNVVRMVTRLPNLEGQGEITIRDLFRNSLRMAPDRVLLGEIRGEEAFDYLQALNSGHRGSLAVLHASSPTEAVVRLSNLVPLARLGVPPRVVLQQIAHGLDLIVQMDQLGDGSRKVTRITEVRGLTADGVVELADLYRFVGEGFDEGRVVGQFMATGELPSFASAFAAEGVELLPSWFGAR